MLRRLSARRPLRVSDEGQDERLRDQHCREIGEQPQESGRVRLAAARPLPDDGAISRCEGCQATRGQRMKARDVTPQQCSGYTTHETIRSRLCEARRCR